MKIAVYNDWWKPDLVGGAEHTSLTAVRELQTQNPSDRFEVFTYSSAFRSSIALIDNLSVRRVFNFALRRKYNANKAVKLFEKIRILIDPISPRLLARAILKSQPNVLVIHNMDRVGIKLVKFVASSGIPVIRVFHDLGDTCMNRKRFKRESPCKKTCLLCIPKSYQHRRIFSIYDGSVACSWYVERKLRSLGFDGSEISVGYPTIIQQSESFFTEKKEKSYSIGFVGRLAPEKGLETLIHGIRILRQKSQQNVELVIAGTGSDAYVSKIKNLSDHAEISTVFTGYLKNPYEYFKNRVDLIVVPSLWEEPLGRVPLEASSFGIPSLVSEIGGLVEAKDLISDGVRFFKPGNPDDLAQKLDFFFRTQLVTKTRLIPYKNMTSALSEIFERYRVGIE